MCCPSFLGKKGGSLEASLYVYVWFWGLQMLCRVYIQRCSSLLLLQCQLCSPAACWGSVFINYGELWRKGTTGSWSIDLLAWEERMSQFFEKPPDIIVALQRLSSDIPGEISEMLENVRKPSNPCTGAPSDKSSTKPMALLPGWSG